MMALCQLQLVNASDGVHTVSSAPLFVDSFFFFSIRDGGHLEDQTQGTGSTGCFDIPCHKVRAIQPRLWICSQHLAFSWQGVGRTRSHRPGSRPARLRGFWVAKARACPFVFHVTDFSFCLFESRTMSGRGSLRQMSGVTSTMTPGFSCSACARAARVVPGS